MGSHKTNEVHKFAFSKIFLWQHDDGYVVERST